MSPDPLLTSLPSLPLAAGFGWLDWGVVAAYFVLTTWLGHKLSGKQEGLDDFFLGGNRLPWYAVAGSMIATTISAVTFVGVPAVAFGVGGDMTYLQLGLVAGLLARVFIALVLIPAYYRDKILSPYDYMGNQLGGGVRGVMTTLFSFGGVLAQASRVYLTAIILELILADELGWVEAAVGVPPLVTSIVLIGVVAMLWTIMGGIATVVWTDVILFAVFVVGGLIALVAVLMRLDGGFGEFVAVGQAAEKFRVFDLGLDLDPTKEFTIWTAAIGTLFGNIGAYGTDQLLAQRLLCCPSPREAKKAILASYAAEAVTLLMLLVGVGLFVYYKGEAGLRFESEVRLSAEDGIDDPQREEMLALIEARYITEDGFLAPAGEAVLGQAMAAALDPSSVDTLVLPAVETPAGNWSRPLPAERAAQFEEDNDRIFPIFILSDAIPPGLTGLIIAGIFAAAISSFDSILAALSQTTISAAVLPWLRRRAGGDPAYEPEPRTVVAISRWLVLVWGVLLCVVAVGIGVYKDRFDLPILSLALGLAGMVQGALLAAFLLAWLPTHRVVNGRGLVWSAPLSVLCVAALRFHSSPAIWTFAVLGGVLLITWIVAAAAGDPRRMPRRLLLTPVLAAGATLPALLSWLAVFPAGRFGFAGETIAWPWWSLVGGAVAFAFGLALADRHETQPRGFAVEPA